MNAPGNIRLQTAMSRLLIFLLTILSTGSQNALVEFWNVDTGKFQRSFSNHTNDVFCPNLSCRYVRSGNRFQRSGVDAVEGLICYNVAANM